MKKYLTILLLTIISSIACSAQAPVKWRSTIKMTSPTEGILTVKAIVSPGYHFYSTKVPANGPVATSLDFKASTGIKFIEDFKPSVQPASHFDKSFNTKIAWWDQTVTFSRRFKVTDRANAVVKGSIKYMACKDDTCTPPRTESVKLNIPAYK